MDSKQFNLNEFEIVSSDITWKFQSSRELLNINSLKRRSWLIAISLRNPAFSNKWLRAAVGLSSMLDGETVITLVDEPYLVSISTLSVSSQTFEDNLNIYRKQSEEQWNRLHKKIQPYFDNVKLVIWQNLYNSTPDSLFNELKDAFKKNGSRVRYLVQIQVNKAHPHINDPETLEKLADFFLDEAPVLINYYYNKAPGCIDLYPKPQAPFFWELDKGNLSKELPCSTHLVKNNWPHVYCHSS